MKWQVKLIKLIWDCGFGLKNKLFQKSLQYLKHMFLSVLEKSHRGPHTFSNICKNARSHAMIFQTAYFPLSQSTLQCFASH